MVERLAADKMQLGRLLLQSSDPSAAAQRGKNIEELEQDVEQTEGQLAKDVAGLGRARQVWLSASNKCRR